METTLIGIAGTVGIGWVAWISITVINNNKEIAAIVMSQNRIQSDTTEMKNMLSSLSNRVDLFLKNEIDALKEIVKKSE